MRAFIVAMVALALVAATGKFVADKFLQPRRTGGGSGAADHQLPPLTDSSSPGVVHALRVKPNEDLYKAIVGYCTERKLSAVSVVSIVGSLRKAELRMANEAVKTSLPPPGVDTTYEIVSLVGTISPLTHAGTSLAHLHMSLSDSNGTTIGGHMLASGNIVYTTAEVVLLEMPRLIFVREPDETYGWNELVVRPHRR